MARRRQTSLLDDLLDISMAIPLWVNVLLAASSFWVLRYYGGTELQGQLLLTGGNGDIGFAVVKLAARVGQYLLPAIFLLGGMAGWIKRKSRARQFDKIGKSRSAAQGIRQLSWEQFEQMVGEAFRRQDYHVEETAKGPDDGIDLVLRKDGELHLVQCKHWKAFKVSVQVVRELYGVMAAQGAAGGFVVTSGDFTSEARKFAQGTSIHLVDGKLLSRWFTSVGEPESENATGPIDVAKARAADPRCPRCADVMVPRYARGGGRVFWGCINFPRCRGTRQLG
ncbi:restriction endonuclease [Azotobacter vinelandii]